MTLMDVAARLDEFDEDYTIYAAELWTAESSAIVAYEPDDEDLPSEAVVSELSTSWRSISPKRSWKA